MLSRTIDVSHLYTSSDIYVHHYFMQNLNEAEPSRTSVAWHYVKIWGPQGHETQPESLYILPLPHSDETQASFKSFN